MYNKNHYIFTGLIVLAITSIAVGIVLIFRRLYPYRGLLYVRQAAISVELGDVFPPAHHHLFHACNFDLGLSNEGCVSLHYTQDINERLILLGDIVLADVVSTKPLSRVNMSVMLCLILAVLSTAWGGIMLFDIIVFVLTVYKATKVGYKVPLIQIVVRDGMC